MTGTGRLALALTAAVLGAASVPAMPQDGLAVHVVEVPDGTREPSAPTPPVTDAVCATPAREPSPAANLVVSQAPSLIPDDYGDEPWTSTPGGPNWHLELIQASRAWSRTIGSHDVKVAVIDVDVRDAHPDLTENLVRTRRFGPPLARQDQTASHGTGVAGVACATGNNGIGIAGVAWQCALSVWDVQTLGSDGAPAVEVDTVIAAMNEAVAAGADVVNLSFGGPQRQGCDTDPDPELAASAAQLADRFDATVESAPSVVWVVSAGNECKHIENVAPALLGIDHANVITVAAANSDGTLAPFSNFGTTVAAGGGFDMSSIAPGAPPDVFAGAFTTGVYSTAALETCDPTCRDVYGYARFIGTSLAAPAVSGIVALARSARPDVSAAEIVDCVETGAVAGGRGVRPLAEPVYAAARSLGWHLTRRYDDADLSGTYLADAGTTIDCVVALPAPAPTDPAGLVAAP